MNILQDRPDAYALRTMRGHPAVKGLWWAAYKNPEDSHTKFLAVGAATAFPEVPPGLPDVDGEDNSHYEFLGLVNLKTGAIEAE